MKKHRRKEATKEFEMFALHSFETLRVSNENAENFKKLAAESEENFLKFLVRNNLIVRKKENDKNE